LLAITAALMLSATLAGAKTKKPSSAHASSHSSKSKSTAHSSSKHRHSTRVKHGAWKHHGQQGIQLERAMAIQKALIREKYLDGEPTGKWDDRTQSAMARYQKDNQWQSKVTPDSRALIKLGLGPDHTADKRLLNLETGNSADAVASTTPASRTAPGNPNR
jgi:hypothetical protein